MSKLYQLWRDTKRPGVLLLAHRCVRRDAPFRTQLDNNGQTSAKALNCYAANDKLWTLVPAQAIAGRFIQSFKEYPASQRVGSMEKLPVPKLLVHLGDASYATYLIHLPPLSVLAKLLFAAGLERAVPQSLLFISLFCIVVAAGSIFHFRAQIVSQNVLSSLNVPTEADGTGPFRPLNG